MAKPNIAFVPLNNITSKNVEAPKKIDEPSYPDQGVSFAGYAKKLISQGNYQLLKQYSYKKIANFTFIASAAGLTLSSEQQNGNDIYIDSIVMSAYSDTDIHVILRQFGSNELLGTLAVKAGMNNSINTKLSAPIKIDSVSYEVIPSAAFTGKIIVNIYGWYEAK